jgi:tetratricopeptide (TPR) repeat protein
LLDRAEEQYLAALELNSSESSALLGLGDLHLRRRDSRAAAEMYRRAVSVDPQSADAYMRLGDAYRQQGDLQAALSEWERASNLRPQDAGLRQRLEQARRESRVQSEYRTRESQHFRVIYEGQRREEIGRDLLRILERAYADVGYELGAYPAQEVEVIFYSDTDFQSATGVSASTMGGGFYHLYDGKIRLGLRGLSPGDAHLAAVLYHEYTHALIYAITRGNNPPRWMHEGLAVQMERERAPEFKREAIRQARAGSVPSLGGSPYELGSVAIGYLIERYGITAIQQLLRRLGEGRGFPQAFQETFRMDVASFEHTLRDVLVRGH